jgi:hypothetical protein
MDVLTRLLISQYLIYIIYKRQVRQTDKTLTELHYTVHVKNILDLSCIYYNLKTVHHNEVNAM